MKAVFLDTGTMGDVSLQPLEDAVDELTCWATTSPEQVVARLQRQDIVLVNKVMLGESHFSQAPSLKFIAVTATGLNNIDLDAARARGIGVANVSAYARPAIVQHTFGLIFALAGKLLDYAHDVREGRWAKSDMFCLLDHPMQELAGKTLGIIGYGDLGQGVAEAARAFGMRVLVAERPGRGSGLKPRDGRLALNEMLPQVDVLSIHCLLSEETRNLIDRDALQSMRPNALVINTARGGIIDEAALAEALREGWIAGAGIDVLTEEPPRNGNPLLEADIPNLIVTPHCAWGTHEARQRMVTFTADNLRSFYQGA